nr:vegetative cell wall protein gp1-like [Aegilops tauschii subsp. strangulata]
MPVAPRSKGHRATRSRWTPPSPEHHHHPDLVASSRASSPSPTSSPRPLPYPYGPRELPPPPFSLARTRSHRGLLPGPRPRSRSFAWPPSAVRPCSRAPVPRCPLRPAAPPARRARRLLLVPAAPPPPASIAATRSRHRATGRRRSSQLAPGSARPRSSPRLAPRLPVVAGPRSLACSPRRPRPARPLHPVAPRPPVAPPPALAPSCHASPGRPLSCCHCSTPAPCSGRSAPARFGRQHALAPSKKVFLENGQEVGFRQCETAVVRNRVHFKDCFVGVVNGDFEAGNLFTPLRERMANRLKLLAESGGSIRGFSMANRLFQACSTMSMNPGCAIQ